MLTTFFRYVGDFLNVLNRSPTSQTCHQHIWSPTSVTNIDVTGINRSKLPCEALHSFKHHFDQFFTLIYSLNPFQNKLFNTIRPKITNLHQVNLPQTQRLTVRSDNLYQKCPENLFFTLKMNKTNNVCTLNGLTDY